MVYKLRWTEEAVHNLENILEHLNDNWTQKEVDNFKNALSRQLSIIQKFPQIFPVSNYHPKFRKSVLSKQTSIFYKFEDYIITITYLHINMSDINSLKG
jgi:plasmid stabilization system protein ParE